MSNKQASAVTVAAGFVVGTVLELLRHYAGVKVSEGWSIAATSALIAVIHFVGSDGIKGAVALIWRGAKVAAVGKPTPPPAK